MDAFAVAVAAGMAVEAVTPPASEVAEIAPADASTEIAVEFQ